MRSRRSNCIPSPFCPLPFPFGHLPRFPLLPLPTNTPLMGRIEPTLWAQSGDWEFKNGTGGRSVYGLHFKDESHKLKHTGRGVVSMVVSRPHTSNSQFMIALDKTEWRTLGGEGAAGVAGGRDLGGRGGTRLPPRSPLWMAVAHRALAGWGRGRRCGCGRQPSSIRRPTTHAWRGTRPPRRSAAVAEAATSPRHTSRPRQLTDR